MSTKTFVKRPDSSRPACYQVSRDRLAGDDVASPFPGGVPMLTAVLLAASLSAAPAAQQACTGPYQIVEAAYRQVLERQPDASSTTFVTALDTGRMTVRELVATLARSPEHVKRFFWAPLISTVYRQVLQRAPGPQEVELATAQLVDQQMTVPEFVANTATRAANGEEDAVRILY